MPELVQTKVTSDYDKFSFLNTNRELSRGHIENLKTSFETYGNFTRVQPVLVNDRFQIIDGQHRFVACEELGEPIYYTVVPGLNVNEARAMNINHRSWGIDDYLHSYIEEGLVDYIKYAKLKEEYEFSHAIMIPYIVGSLDKTHGYKSFREGEFVIPSHADAVKRLNALAEVQEVIGSLALVRPFALAYLSVMRTPGFDQKRMLNKFKQVGDELKKLSTVEDNLRQLEDAYNFKQTAGTRTRLY